MLARREFVITKNFANATDAVNTAIPLPYDCELQRVECRFTVTSTSGTLDVRKVADGTAIGSGTSMLTGTMDLSGTADTKVQGTVDQSAKRMAAGQAIGLVFAGTLTGLVNLEVIIVLRQTSLER